MVNATSAAPVRVCVETVARLLTCAVGAVSIVTVAAVMSQRFAMRTTPAITQSASECDNAVELIKAGAAFDTFLLLKYKGAMTRRDYKYYRITLYMA
jgi:hypothetical protein